MAHSASGTSKFSRFASLTTQPKPVQPAYQATMVPPITAATTGPLSPSLAHAHEHNIVRCDDSVEKDGSDKVSPSLNNDISSSLLSAQIVANALRPFLGKANEYTCSTTGSKGSNAEEGNSIPRRSGLDILTSLNIHDNSVARQIVKLAVRQNTDFGDGTKTAVILAGSILDAAARLLDSSKDEENDNGMNPLQIASAFADAADYAVEVVSAHSQQVDIANPERLQSLCHHHLSSSFSGSNGDGDNEKAKIVSNLTIDAILKLDEQIGEEECLPDLENIYLVHEISGDVEESEVFSGFILQRPESEVGGHDPDSNNARIANSAMSVVTSTTEAAPKALEGDIKVAMLEYWLSPTQIPANCDEETREEMLREDRRRLLGDCKEIKKSGARVVLIAARESGVRDGREGKNENEAESEIDVDLQISLHFLAKMGIMAIHSLDEKQMSAAISSLGGMVIPFPENISLKELGSTKQVQEVKAPSGRSWIHFEGTRTPTATIMLHGPSEASVEESRYTVGRILSFVENLFRDPHVVAGGGGAEIEASLRLRIQCSTDAADDVYSQCVRAFADALEVIPYTLAENADINPAAVVTALRRQHAEGQTAAGLDIGDVGGIHVDMIDAGIVTSLSTQVSAIQLATALACDILEGKNES